MNSGSSSPIYQAHIQGTGMISGSSSPTNQQHPSPALDHTPHQSQRASPTRSVHGSFSPSSPLHPIGSPTLTTSSPQSQASYASARHSVKGSCLADILIEIQDSKPHKMQLELWEKEEDALRWLINQGEANCSRPLNEIYQLLSFYFVFQGVIFAGVAQSNILSCKDRWSPFCLSLVAVLAALCAVHHKLAALAEAKRDLQIERNRANALYSTILDMRTQGVDFDLRREPFVQTPREAELDFYTKYLSTCGIAITVVLVTFSAVIMVTSLKVLCRECEC